MLNKNLDDEYSYEVAMNAINKKEEKKPTAIGQIGNAIVNGADLFMAKIDDIGSLATGVALLPYEWLSGNKGEVTRYLEENEQRKTELQNNIKRRREELDRYIEANPLSGSVLKVASSFAEQTVDPLQMGMNIATNGFYMNALQNTLDYIYEEHLLNDRKITDLNTGDLTNIGVGIAMAGLTSKLQVDDITKPLYDDYIPPLDRIAKDNIEFGDRILNKKAVAEIIKRKQTGQTLSLKKGHTNTEVIGKTIDDGVIAKLKQVSNIIQDEALSKKYLEAKIKDGDVKMKNEVSRIMKPLHTEISLGRKQALGEIAEELGGWSIKNNKYDGVSNVGDYLDTVLKDIDPEELVRIYQGKSKDPAYKDLQPILHKYINEFVSIKSKTDLTYKEDGFYINTLYNKQHIMTKLKSIENNPEEILGFIKGQMKDIGSKVFLTEKEALAVGLKGKGFYSIDKNPAELLKALYYDINATTKAVSKSNRKGDIGIEGKTIYDIALNWVDMKNKNRYAELIKKTNPTEKEKVFIKKFNDEMLGKFETLFKGYEQDKREVLENIVSTIINERSGYNKAMDKFGNFSTAYNFNDEATKNIEWLDFTMPKEMTNSLISEVDGLRNLSAYNIVRAKNYNDLSLNDKSIKGMKDFASWKLLFGLRHLREASPNTALINTGAHRLGFNERMGFIKGNFTMYKAHYNLLKNYDTLISRDLSSIADPVERMQTELFVRRIVENGYNFDKWGAAKTLDRLAFIGGAGQSVSDVHRIGSALRFTSKAMFEEFPNMKYDAMTPEMRSILKNNGIDEKILSDIQNQIKGFKTYNEFFDFIMNSDLQTGGKIKSLFEQFTDVMGREFEAYDKNLTRIHSDKPLAKLWLNSNMLFKRYSMGAFSRALETATSYYDSNDILRSRYLKEGHLNLDNTFNGFWKGFKHHSINLSKMSAGLWISTQAVRYAHGKMFGTADNEMVEAKYEAFLNGEYLPILAEGFKDSLTDYIGYDIMFGGGPAFFSIIGQTIRALTRAFTNDDLEPEEKILYGLSYIVSPMNISRGIDIMKFGRNITTNLNSWSGEANFLWKEYYRKDALYEQAEGELPIEKAVKKGFEKISDWKDFFDKNPDKAYEVTNFPDDIDKEIVKTTASGVMELAERSIRDDHIMYSFSIDDVNEREESLKEFGLDYKSQLLKLDPNIRDLFNYVMAFKDVKDPMYVIMALEEITNAKNKVDKLHEFLREDEIPYFDNFAKNIIAHQEKKKELARRGYQDNTEGYLEFLQALRNEI